MSVAPSDAAFLSSTDLRKRFAQMLSDLYGREVPAYTTLLEVSREVNLDVVAADVPTAQQLGSLDRITAERHGAIRVGTARELRQASRIFAAMGMYPVGFYDLRDAAPTPVPVVATAFRPIETRELAANPFRVFTSVLATDDLRFFTPAMQQRIEVFLAQRVLFGDELLALAETAANNDGLRADDADRFLALATQSFALSTDPVDSEWYRSLESISSVAADIAGVSTTHINHLTPRVLDIDELSRRMIHRGIEMIPEIQGPPRWDGPAVLLRQTSFRALAEPRRMREADGTVQVRDLRTRFGEVESRGVALTPAGRDRVDALAAEVDAEVRSSPHSERSRVAADLWSQAFPATYAALAASGYAYCRYSAVPGRGPAPLGTGLTALVDGGWLRVDPIVYEDFLPRSAAGIFQSNLTSASQVNGPRGGVERNIGWLSEILETQVHLPERLYETQSADSVIRSLAGMRPTDRRGAERPNRDLPSSK